MLTKIVFFVKTTLLIIIIDKKREITVERIKGVNYNMSNKINMFGYTHNITNVKD